MSLEVSLIESIVSNFLWAIAKDWLVERQPRHFDFVSETAVGQRTALEVLGNPPSQQN